MLACLLIFDLLKFVKAQIDFQAQVYLLCELFGSYKAWNYQANASFADINP